MRILITGGGTGGHVYPALAVAAALNDEKAPSSLLYVGTSSGIEADLVERHNIPFVPIKAGALRGRSPLRFLINLGEMAWGIIQSFFILRRFRPQAILATGGYVCAPVVFAGWLRRIPILIYLPDVEPGWAIRFLAVFATKVAVTSGKSKAFLPSHKVVKTGYPVRPAFAKLDKRTAKASLQLDPHLKTLLIYGGSLGARSINMAVSKILPQLLDLCQIIHLSGGRDEAWLQELRAKLPEGQSQRYKLYAYLHDEFPPALAAADLAISRAGAAIMGEFPAVGLPSIIIPYPYAGAHQRHNAQFMVERGAAIELEDSGLDALLPTIQRLLNDEGFLAEMSENARSLARPDAAEKIAALLREIYKGKANESQPEFSCAN